jgi:hypothetical protein
MVFLINLGQRCLMLQAQEPAEVKYIVALIAAIASITVAFFSATISVFSLLMTRRNQSALQKEQAQLTSRNQTELAHLQTVLTLKSQGELEKAKADLSARNQEEMELLRAKLSERGKERDARRDYEYEAHKRLYTQCSPLLFQLADLAEHGYHRVYSLARSARLGMLPRWLEGDGYYFRSTLYRLLAPLVIFRLIQQRLTLVDLTLDAYMANQYRLLKLLYLTFTDPFDFAAIEPKIEYRPDVDDWKIKREADERTYWRQGLYLGSLDNAIDALLVARSDRGLLWKTYGEFELEYKDRDSDIHKRLDTFADVLHGFHPRNRPVLWRMLLAQTLIYKQIIESQSAAAVGDGSEITLVSVSLSLPSRGLDWRSDEGEASVEEAVLIPQRAAQEYLHLRLPDVFKATH